MKTFKNLNQNIEVIKKLCRSCVYFHEKNKENKVLKNMQEFKIDHVNFLIGFLDKKTLVVVFEGSNGIQDWVDNLNFKMVAITNIKNLKIHNGFFSQFLKIYELLCSLLFLYKDKDVIFTGHSLGAALATIASFYFKYVDRKRNIACVTFGSPRVGNGVLTKLFIKLVLFSWRYVSGEDSVTKVPFYLNTFKGLSNWVKPEWISYRHVLIKIKINQKLSWIEKLLYIPRKIFGNPMDHAVKENYLDKL